MSTTDPISDFLTRLRNAAKAGHKRVDIPASGMKKALSKILLDQKFIAGYSLLEDGKQGIIRIQLKYHDGQPVITGLRRVSKPGIRRYRDARNLPRVRGGLGIAVISTSSGLMTDLQARRSNVGGEVVAFIW